MSTTRRRALANILAGSAIAVALAGLLLLVLTVDTPPRGGWGFRGFPAIFVLGSTSIGWLIMVRRPDNRIGLVLALIGLLNALQLFLTEYAAQATRTGLPGAMLAGLVNASIWVPTLALVAGAVPLLFPDGSLASPRWRPVAWLAALSAAALILIITLYPDALDTPRFVQRPFSTPIPDTTLNTGAYVALAGLGVGIVGAGLSLILRWRRATGVVREQLKWLALSVAFVVATMWLAIVPNPLAVALFIVAIGTVPLAVGIAVLRYHLYDIDTVISRTLVFGLLTAVLTGLFAGLQRLFQAIFVGVTGNESDAAIVITTLVLAAGFAPMKSALERFVSRRFASSASGPSGSTSAVVGGSELGPDLEAALRRVVREEMRTALGLARETAAETGLPEARGGPVVLPEMGAE
jgi:hypothetical protein